MRVLALVSAAIALALTPGQGPLKLKPGDVVAITSSYGGEFKVMPDGAIYGRGFGRLVLEGSTWEEAQAAARRALAKYVRPDEIHLTVKELAREVVYLVGLSGGKGPVELTPKLTLRQLLAAAPLDENADRVEVQVYRDGTKVCSMTVARLLSGSADTPDQALKANDVVTLTPVAFHRVWVTGLVSKPGQLKVPDGTDVYQAIAEAGGIRLPELEPDTVLQQGGSITVNRGPEQFTLPIRPGAQDKPFRLESGDTVTVVAPELRRITVAGQVMKPGEIAMRGDHTLTGAIAMAGGCDPDGTLRGVLVLRKGEVFRLDASPAVSQANQALAEGSTFPLESGDLVVVQRNESTFLVLGEVAKAGRVTMKDARRYRLSDALAEAGGLTGRGSFRRVYVATSDPSGKMRVVQYNLDEYLKDGRLESNPEIRAGDCVLFGQPKGLTLANASQFLSSALLFEALVNPK